VTQDDELSRLRSENQALRKRLEASAPSSPEPSSSLAALLQAIPAFIMRLDEGLHIRYLNRLQPGLRREDAIGRTAMSFIPAELHDLARSTISEVRSSGEPGRFDTSGEGANGATAYYETHVTRVEDPNGDRAIWLVAVDVTAHRERQRALEDSEQRLRLAVEATGIGLWSFDLATGKATWDERMQAICGSESPLPPEAYMAIVHPADQEKVAAAFAEVGRTAEWSGVKHRLVHRDGSIRWVLPMGRVIREGDVPVRILGANLDVSGQTALEEKLREAQTLQAVGRLTAGLAHNFNNLLAGLLPTLDLLAPAVPHSHLELVADASHAAQRAAELVRQLMTFAGQRRATPRGNNAVRPLVDAALAICVRTFQSHIQIEANWPTSLPLVFCDAGAIEQVLLNLLLNARDAIMDANVANAQIRLEAELLPAPPERVAEGDHRRFVCVRIRDNGTGIAEEDRSKIFEPFFTTKPVGRGTGLGLASSFAIMREHGGFITCDSQPGAGAVFSIFLPEGDDVAAPSKLPSSPPPALVSVHVLVVDDEELVRRVARRSLEADGYTVTTAGGGAEALQCLDRAADVRVVLLDRSMGDAQGDHLLPEIRRRSPNAKIILFTGQTVESELEAKVDGVLLKPVRPNQLTLAIAAVLDSKARG